MDIVIGEVIRQKRREREMSQERLAQEFNVSVQAVSKWETGSSLPDISLVPCIAEFFGVSMDYLFSGKESKPLCFEEIPDDDVIRVVQLRGRTIIKDGQQNSDQMTLEIPPHENVSIEIWGGATVNGDINGNIKAAGFCAQGNINGNVECGGASIMGDLRGVLNCGGDASIYGDVEQEINCGGSCKVVGDVNGDINCGADCSVEKNVAGDVNCGADCTVGNDLYGDLSCGLNSTINGDVNGDVECSGAVTVKGDVNGSVSSEGSLTVGGDITIMNGGIEKCGNIKCCDLSCEHINCTGTVQTHSECE